MIEIRCNGNVVRGFTDVKITRSLDQFSASYSIGVFKAVSNEDGASDSEKSAWLPVFPGDEVEIVVDGETVIRGFNDTTCPSFTNSGISCMVSGRERTCDIVDCVPERLDYENKKVDEIVRLICNEFDVTFKGSSVDVGAPLKKFSANPSSSAFEAIKAACAERRLLARTDGLGNVTLDSGSYDNADVDLVQGVNVLSASGNFSVKDRYSQYKVYASKDAKGKTFAEVSDDEISRTRNWMMLEDRYGCKEDCEKRAMWEAKHRQAMSGTLGVMVSGWRQKDGGNLWRPGLIVTCDIPAILGETRQFLVNRVTFSFGTSGSQTSLELVDTDVYAPMPSIAPKKKAVKQKKDVWASVRKQTGSKLK